MGVGNFFKKFGSTLLKAAPFVAAPFTGGASLALAPLTGAAGGALDALGAGAAGASQAAASNRGTKAELLLDQNRDLESQLIMREREKRDAQKQAYRAAMGGEYASSFKPSVRPAGIPGSYEGPTQASRDIGATLYKQAMSRLQSPDLNNMRGMQPYNDLSKNKEFTKTMSPGFWEKLGNITSVAAPALGRLGVGGRPPMTNGVLPDPIDPNTYNN